MPKVKPDLPWPETQRMPGGGAPRAARRPETLDGPATQVVVSKEDYLGQGRYDLGRRIADDQVELFITGEVAPALRAELQRHMPEFIALHDVGTSASLRLLAGLAGAAGARVQRLSVRRQGQGVALAVLQFVEVPLGDGSRVRVYSTDISADGQARQQMAQVLLGHSRLGVLMVGELPPHAMTSALMPVREAVAHGPWPNRELLMLPLGSGTALAAQAAQITAGGPVAVHVTPRAAKPRHAWQFVAGAWNRLNNLPGGSRHLSTELGQAVPAPAVPQSQMETQPMGLDGAESEVGEDGTGGQSAPGSGSATDAPGIRPAQGGLARAGGRPHPGAGAGPAGAAGTPASSATPPDARSPGSSGEPHLGLRLQLQAEAQTTRQPAPATVLAPMPVPGGTQWATYVERVVQLKGAVSCCVFDVHTLQTLAHAGSLPSGERLAQQGAQLLFAMADTARALGLSTGHTEAAITTGAHHLVLRPVPGHPGVALHLILEAAATNLTLARMQLERVDSPA